MAPLSEKQRYQLNDLREHALSHIFKNQTPDAVVYEAMINTLVTLRRMDLVPQFLKRLESSGVHMTAYIANLLIKGYASVNEIERSREVFESLLDPQEGVAAPHNHAPHQNKQPNVLPVPAGTPVYREVSIQAVESVLEY